MQRWGHHTCSEFDNLCQEGGNVDGTRGGRLGSSRNFSRAVDVSELHLWLQVRGIRCMSAQAEDKGRCKRIRIQISVCSPGAKD